MIKRVVAVFIAIIVLLILVILGIVAYFLIVDIQSKNPKSIEQDCMITTKNFVGRKVFIIEPIIKSDENKYILYFHGGSYVA